MGRRRLRDWMKEQMNTLGVFDKGLPFWCRMVPMIWADRCEKEYIFSASKRPINNQEMFWSEKPAASASGACMQQPHLSASAQPKSPIIIAFLCLKFLQKANWTKKHFLHIEATSDKGLTSAYRARGRKCVITFSDDMKILFFLELPKILCNQRNPWNFVNFILQTCELWLTVLDSRCLAPAPGSLRRRKPLWALCPCGQG